MYKRVLILIQKNFQNYENPLDGYSKDFLDFLLKKPNLFSRKSIPIFWPTGAYSFGKCLRLFCGWPSFLPIPVYLDHGSFVGIYLDHHEIDNKAIHHLTWYEPKFLKSKNKILKNKKILYITSPQILYKRKMNFKLKPNAKGTILFIPHTTGDVEFSNNKEDWLAYISNWVDRALAEISPNPPYVLCFHQQDIRMGYHNTLKNKFPIVTAGNPQDEMFIDRFYYLISHFRNSISNAVGTDTLLCHELGLNHMIYGEEPKPIIVKKGFDYVDRHDDHYQKKLNYVRKFFMFPKKKSDENFRDQIIFNHLGFSSTINPNTLRKIFLLDFFKLMPYFFYQYVAYFIKLIKKFITYKH